MVVKNNYIDFFFSRKFVNNILRNDVTRHLARSEETLVESFAKADGSLAQRGRVVDDLNTKEYHSGSD